MTNDHHVQHHRQHRNSRDEGTSSTTTLNRTRLVRKKERLNTELLNATISSDLSLVKRLLNEGACPWAKCRTTKSSSIHLAAFCGQPDILEILLDAGAELDLRDENGVQVAHIATWAGHLHILELIFTKRPDLVNSPVMPGEDANPELLDDLDSWDHDHQIISQKMPVFEVGSTPLHIACKLNKVETVEYLLAQGADVHLRDQQGLTPLDVAGTHVVEKNPINNNLKTCSGSTTEQSIISQDEPDANTMVDDDQQQSDGNDQEDISSDITKTSHQNKSTMLGIVNALFENGARMQNEEDILFIGKHGWNLPITALHTAVANCDIELINYLLSKGANLFNIDENGETPLHLAIRKNLLEPLKTMLSWLTVDMIDIKDGNGMTPLHLAILQEWPSGIGLLLEAGADVTIRTDNNETVLHLAAKIGSEILLEEFLSIEDSLQVIEIQDNDNYTALFRAIESESPACVKLLIKQGAKVNNKLPCNKSALHLAVEIMSEEILKLLLDQEILDSTSINSLFEAEEGRMTPLHMAAENGSVECVKILIKHGAEIFQRMGDIYGSTAAHLAACEGHSNVLSVLIGHNAKCINIPDHQGWFPLHLAARYGHGHCAVLLLKHGANISANIPDNAVTKSALDLIVEYVPKGIDQLESLFDSFIDYESCSIKDPSCLISLNYTLLLGKQYDRNAKDHKQMEFCNTLLNSNNVHLKETLLLHPLTESFLYFKWMSMRNFFIVLICFYVFYTISLTTFAINTYVTYNLTISLIFRIISLILLVPIITSEFLQAGTLQRYYFVDDESWLRWTMVICGGLVSLSHPETNLSRHLASMAVLLSWIELLFLFARFPMWGLHVLMFEKVASNVFQVLSRFVFLIFGFLFAFMIHFGGAAPFGNFWEALCKVFIMIVELDYSAAFSDENDNVLLSLQSTWYTLFGRLMYVTFVVLVAMVMMNLIVGLCVSDIALLEVQGRTQRLAKQTAFLSFLEMSVYNRCLLIWLPSILQEFIRDCRAVPASITIFPNDPRCPLPSRLRRTLLKRVKTPAKGDQDESEQETTVNLKLYQIDSNVNLLNKQINEIKDSVANVNNALTQLISLQSNN